MAWKSKLKSLIERTGYTLRKLPTAQSVYDQDGLVSVHNHDFMDDPAFRAAYERGCRVAGDYHWHWRIHLALWSAATAQHLDGDFVECGVNRGFLCSAVMQYLNWNTTNRTFFLLDTFDGIDVTQITDQNERLDAAARNEEHFRSGFYVRGADSVRASVAEWHNVRIIVGAVPGTLSQIDSPQIAWLHLDMNCAEPERAALEFLWDRLVPGALVLLDDYAYRGFAAQKRSMDEFAVSRGVAIASLPTGQGLLVRPPR